MVKCPFCDKEIESDSFYCDQCGQELKICSHGHGFKKGKICTECGTPLTEAKDIASPDVNPDIQPIEPTFLVNTALNTRLHLSDGAVIGRRVGDYLHVFGSQGYVSGTHARLQRNGLGGWEIIDLDSTNGTFLNGVRLSPQQATPFKVGDTIAFYDLKFIVE